MTSTMPPVATSAKLRPFMVPGSGTGGPGFVVAAGHPPGAADIVMPGRSVGMGGAGQVRLLLALPEVALGLGQRRGHGVVQLGMPFGRHHGRVRAPDEDRPAAGPVVDRLLRPALVVDIAEAVGPYLAAG